MDVLPFVKAVGIGLAIAAPVGPMGLLCIRRTLTQGWQFGMSTGLGIATGDAIYACVAALGLASITHFVLAYDKPLHLLAGASLIYLGARTFFTRSCEHATPAAASGYASSLLLTLTNPPTIVSFAAVFTFLAPPNGFNPASALVTVAGVFCGSVLWWLALTSGVALARHAIGARTRRAIDLISGAALSFFGVAELRRAA